MKVVEDFVSIVAEKKATIPPKSINVLFNNPVAEATGYNHATPAGVLGLS